MCQAQEAVAPDERDVYCSEAALDHGLLNALYPLMRKLALILTVLAAAVVAGWFLRRPTGPRAVFLIIVDTLRPDRLSCYGSRDPKTPQVDRLAASGALFANAQSAASWTIPSVASILTSLYPSQLGLVELPLDPPRKLQWRDRRDQIVERLSRDATTLPEVLAHRGFHTAAFVDQPAINAREGFDQGFDEWFVPTRSGTVMRVVHEAGQKLDEGLSWNGQARADLAVVDGFIDWLKRNSRKRMFVWIHLLSPHMPYNPPRGYRSTPGREPIDSYDGEVRYIDDLTGRLLDAIDLNIGQTISCA